jgi:hypothetical protein
MLSACGTKSPSGDDVIADRNKAFADCIKAIPSADPIPTTLAQAKAFRNSLPDSDPRKAQITACVPSR